MSKSSNQVTGEVWKDQQLVTAFLTGVRAALPNLPKAAAGGTAAAGKCDVQVRITDSIGIESNTLKTAVEFRN